MFSGIIDAMGTVQESAAVTGGRRLVVAAAGYWTGVAPGASIAIDGVCLTVTELRGETAAFDVVAETLRKTTLGELQPGDAVNLQKSLAAGDRIDGHFVQGHVDGTALVQRVEQSPAEARWWFAPPRELLPYIIHKGSVAIDGISLTIAEVKKNVFAVALIPTTLERTTLGRKQSGARVNIETDVLARTVVQYIQSIVDPARRPSGVTLEQLREHGFA